MLTEGDTHFLQLPCDLYEISKGVNMRGVNGHCPDRMARSNHGAFKEHGAKSVAPTVMLQHIVLRYVTYLLQKERI